MSALAEFVEEVPTVAEPYLRLVHSPQTTWRTGPALAVRRSARRRARRRRGRALTVSGVILGVAILSWPGHALGGTTGTGLPTDLATGSSLASGMVYVVQPGDTIDSIARLANPVDPAEARQLLVRELRSAVVVPGEHVLIP